MRGRRSAQHPVRALKYGGRAVWRQLERPSRRPVHNRHGLSRRALALTFDDGPAEWTAPILDALGEAGCRATFFVLGEAIPGREQTLRRMRDAGHEIGNHSRTHPPLDTLRRAEVRAELASTNEIVEEVVGTQPRLFRPPYLRDSKAVRAVAAKLGFAHTIHGLVTDDFLRESGEEIAAIMLEHARPGSILVLHDGRSGRDTPEESREDRLPTVEAVRLMLPELRARGFELLTVSELLAL